MPGWDTKFLSNTNKGRVINQGTINFDFTNNLIKFNGVGVVYGKVNLAITQNLSTTGLTATFRYILFYNTATSLLGATDVTAMALPDTAIVLGMFRISDLRVWGIEFYQINGVDRFISDINRVTINTSAQLESAKVYPVKSNNLSPLASSGIISGSPINFDFINSKIILQDARIIFGNRSESITSIELNISGFNTTAFYILFYDLATVQLGAVSQSYGTEYGTLSETSIILGTFKIASEYVEGVTNYTVNGKSYKILSPDDLVKSDYPVLDYDLTGIFNKNVTIPSQAANITASTASTIYQMYDALMTQHPAYITKTLMGNEASPDALPIYRYDFKIVRPTSIQNTKNAKVILLSGVHPERTAVWTLYNTINNICNNWANDKILEAIRFNIDLIVVPLVNPYSYNGGTRTNFNGVDINRNFPINWVQGTQGTPTYGGSAPLSEIESQLINTLMLNERLNVLGLIDFHNFDVPSNNYFFLLGFPGNNLTSNIMRSLIQRMDRKWKKEYAFVNQDVGTFIGDVQNIIPGAINTQASSYGIKGAIAFEVDHKVYADSSSVLNDSNTMTMGYEAFVNFFAMFVNELLKRN